MGNTYSNESGDSRVVKKITTKKGPAESNKLIWWEGSKGNEEGISAASIFYDWIEGNYDDGSRRRRPRR